MSLFPYNNRKHAGYGSQGSPLNFKQAHDLAYEVFFWHSQIAESDDWTQSASGAEGEINDVALGLMTMLAEPSFVRMIADMGACARERLDTLRAIRDRHEDDAVYAVLADLGIAMPSKKSEALS